MNIWDKMKSCEPDMTPKEHEVYELLKQHTFLFSSSTASELASRFGIAQSAISRFCKKIGYEGYSDFRLAIYASIYSQPVNHAALQPSQDSAYYISQLVLETRKMLSEEQLIRLCHKMKNASAVFSTGHGNSYPPAYILALHLMLCKIPSHTIQPGFEIETLHMVKPNDVIVLFSAENPTHRDFLSFIDELPQQDRPYIVLVTNTKQHPLRKMVDEIVVLPTWESLHYPMYVDSSIGPIMFCFLFIETFHREILGQENTPPREDSCLKEKVVQRLTARKP